MTPRPPGSPRRLASPGVGRSRPGVSVLLLLLAKVSLVTKPVRLARSPQRDAAERPHLHWEAGAQERRPSAGWATLPRKRTLSAFTIAIRKGLLNTTI